MRWVTYLRAGEARAALVDGASVIDLDEYSDLRAALRSGSDLNALARRLIKSDAARRPLAELSYAPLIPEPSKVICLGLNYLDHAREAKRDTPEYPWFFCRTPSSLLGHEKPAVLPRISSKL